MSEQAAPPEGGRRRRATQRRRPSLRVVAGVLGAVLLVLVLAGAWVGWRGLAAKDHLDEAQSAIDTLRAQLRDGDTEAAADTLASVRADTSSARSLTGDPVWRAAGALPFVGDSAGAVTTTTAAVDQVAQQVLPVLVEQAEAVAPSSLRVGGGRLDVDRIAAAAPALADAQTEANAAASKVEGIETAGLPARLRTPVESARSGLGELASLTTDAADAARLLPSMLGADGPRRYFLAFQTNAEARATGGLVGAYGVLEADEGRLRVVTLGPRSKLDRGNLDEPAVDLGADYRALYGDDPGLWVNTNLSPHLPHAAQLWIAMYEKQTGSKLDGAIATDPVALGYLLDATGPATLPDGTSVTGANVAKLTMSEVYERYPDDDAKRDAFLQLVARGAVTNLLSGKGDAADIASALGRAAGEGRLGIYSTDEADQRTLATTPLGGSVAAEPGPYVGVFANSGSASKLDYYLDASVDYALEACTGADLRRSTVTVTLENTAPKRGLPTYVTGPRTQAGAISNLDLMAVHLPVGAVVRGATLDGERLGVSPHRLLGRPVVTFPVRLDAGQRSVVVLDLAEPRSAAEPRIQGQAFARTPRLAHSGSVCSG